MVRGIIQCTADGLESIGGMKDDLDKRVNDHEAKIVQIVSGVEGSMGNVQQAMSTVQQAIVTIEKRLQEVEKSGGKSSGKGDRRIMEQKVVQNVRDIPEDKSLFRQWHRKFVNAMDSVHEGYGDILVAIAKQIDGGEKPNEVEESIQ